MSFEVPIHKFDVVDPRIVVADLEKACESLMNTFWPWYDPLNAEHVTVWNGAKQALKQAKGE